MSRSLSLTARQAIYSQETGEVFLFLLAIEHADLAAPIRVVNNTQNIASRGSDYSAFPFDVTLPGEDAETIQQVTLRIDNVDRQIVQAIRTITGAPTVTLEVILASAPDTVEAGPFVFTMRDVRYDALTVQGALTFEDLLNTRLPAHQMTPTTFPGIF